MASSNTNYHKQTRRHTKTELAIDIAVIVGGMAREILWAGIRIDLETRGRGSVRHVILARVCYNWHVAVCRWLGLCVRGCFVHGSGA